jgi:hypothetical protein
MRDKSTSDPFKTNAAPAQSPAMRNARAADTRNPSDLPGGIPMSSETTAMSLHSIPAALNCDWRS